MLEDVLHLLTCPHCTAPLSREQGSLRCSRGHSFDVARSGYASLLPGDARLGSADTADMVAAREAFLGAGHFEPLAEALAHEGQRAGLPEGCLIDLGAGTGWYLAHMLERQPGRPGLALDLSKHALRRAARAHPRIGAVACDVWGPLPVTGSAAALVISVFAPRNGPEIARVLRPGGALVVATPTGRHLAELVDEFGLLSVDERKQERLGASLDEHLDLERRVEREWTLQLTPADVTNAIGMGPSAHHVTAEVRGETRRVTASVTISTYRAGSG
jgi:23S rRNA (guanine745-N1)-methyltransferase